MAFLAVASPATVATGTLLVGLILAVWLLVMRSKRALLARRLDISPAELQTLLDRIGGSVRKDGDDILIAGSLSGRPVSVRFSERTDAPGVTMRTPVASKVHLIVTRQQIGSTSGLHLLRERDPNLQFRQVYGSDVHTAKRLLENEPFIRPLRAILPTGADVVLESAGLEVRLAEMPRQLVNTVGSGLQELCALAASAESALGARKAAKPQASGVGFMIGAAAIAVIALVAVIVVRNIPAAQSTTVEASGLAPEEESRIPDLGGWRLYQAAKLPQPIGDWMEANGVQANSRVDLRLNESTAPSTAMLLGNKQIPETRLVIVGAGEKPVYDAQVSSPVIIRIDRRDLENISWKVPPVRPSEGDGLLYFEHPDGAPEPVIIVFNEGKPISGVPNDFRAIKLRFPPL